MLGTCSTSSLTATSTSNEITRRLLQLGTSKQKYLLSLLEKIEAAEDPDALPALDVSNGSAPRSCSPASCAAGPPSGAAVKLNGSSSCGAFRTTINTGQPPERLPSAERGGSEQEPKAAAGNATSSSHSDERGSFSLVVLDNWGHSTETGLTELELLDLEGRPVAGVAERYKLQLLERSAADADAPFRVLLAEGHPQLFRVCNGQCKTTESGHMLAIPTPREPAVLEFAFSVPVGEKISGVRLWNYNAAASQDTARGVRSAELRRGATLLWQGQVQRGCGNSLFSNFTAVPLLSSASCRPAGSERCAANAELAGSNSVLLRQLPLAVAAMHAPLDHSLLVSPPTSPPSSTPLPQAAAQLVKPPQIFPLSPTDSMSPPQSPACQLQTQQLHDPMQNPVWLSGSRPVRFERKHEDSFAEAMHSESEASRGRNRSPGTRPQFLGGGSRGGAALDAETTAVQSVLGRRRPQRHNEAEVDDLSDLNASLSSLSTFFKPGARPFGGLESLLPAEDALDELQEEASVVVRPRVAREQEEAHRPRGRSGDAALIDRCLAPESLLAVPRLPRGAHLQLDILSTWGDPNYVGLGGIEMLDHDGEIVSVSDPQQQVTANPSGVHELPGMQHDPRTVDKLFDGVNTTSDGKHMWLAPFSPGQRHVVSIMLDQPVVLSRLRFWNYNASRAHAQRGARHVELRLDENLIFSGELTCASGDHARVERLATTVVFCDDRQILNLLEARDEMEELAERRRQQQAESEVEQELMLTARPSTASGHSELFDGLGSTSEAATPSSAADAPWATDLRSAATGTELRCTILSTWGDNNYFGLAGLQILDEQGMSIYLYPDQLKACPSDLNELNGGYGGDPRTVDKILDPVNVTTDSNHMWLAPWQPASGVPHTLTVKLTDLECVCALRVWNYNKSEEDSYRGVRRMRVELDGELLTPMEGVVLRKAPGHQRFDFGQTVPLCKPATTASATEPSGASATPSLQRYAPVSQDSWAPVLPMGHILHLRLLSTWGDAHYIGLDALQLFDAEGQTLCGPCMRVHAAPADVNELPNMSGDPRTVHKLFTQDAKQQGVASGGVPLPPCQTPKASTDVWLAPWIPKQANELWLYFDAPVRLSLLRVLNYSKSPARGVQDFELLLDDSLIYRGKLRRSEEGDGTAMWQSILFTDSPAILASESSRVFYSGSHEADHVLLINDGQVMNPGGDFATRDVPAQVHAQQRPTTAAVPYPDEF